MPPDVHTSEVPVRQICSKCIAGLCIVFFLRDYNLHFISGNKIVTMVRANQPRPDLFHEVCQLEQTSVWSISWVFFSTSCCRCALTQVYPDTFCPFCAVFKLRTFHTNTFAMIFIRINVRVILDKI